jgi:anti-anti-sigma factor
MSLPLSVRADQITTVRIAHKFVDGAAVRALRRLVRYRLHLDFRDVRLVTASGLGQLVVLHQALRARGGRLTLGGLSAHLREVFEVTRLTRVLDVRP